MFSKAVPNSGPEHLVLTEQLLQGSPQRAGMLPLMQSNDTLLISWPLSCPNLLQAEAKRPSCQMSQAEVGWAMRGSSLLQSQRTHGSAIPDARGSKQSQPQWRAAAALALERERRERDARWQGDPARAEPMAPEPQATRHELESSEQFLSLFAC